MSWVLEHEEEFARQAGGGGRKWQSRPAMTGIYRENLNLGAKALTNSCSCNGNMRECGKLESKLLKTLGVFSPFPFLF